MNTPDEVVEKSTSDEKVPKKSKGKLFKEAYGYSKTMKRLMQKYHCSSIEQYREVRKRNKKLNRAKAIPKLKK